jgi:pimeloyl-ACP methyl ester carboxylesterase
VKQADRGSPPDLRFARTNDGAMIAYTISGEGPPLVWLPPMPFSDIGEQWHVPSLRAAYDRLGEHVTLVLYDGRGTGQSQRDIGDIGLEAMLADLDGVIRDAGLTSFALLGYYFSVATAIAYAARHQDRVTKLVLFGGALDLQDVLGTPTNTALTAVIGQSWEMSVDAAVVSWMGWDDAEENRRVAEVYRGSTSPSIAQATFEAARTIDVTADARALAVPALVLHREGERLTPLAVSQRLAAALPAGRLIRLEGSSGGLFAGGRPDDVEPVVGFLTGERPVARPEVIGALGASSHPDAYERGIFISVSERRKEAVAWPFRDRLAAHGLRAFIVSDEPRPVGTWTPEEKVDAFLDRSDAVVVFATADVESGDDRFTRPNIGDEIARARSKPHLRDRVVVLKEHGVTLPSNIDPAYESLDLSDPDRAFDRASLQLAEWGISPFVGAPSRLRSDQSPRVVP